jgi:hypothetical protein
VAAFGGGPSIVPRAYPSEFWARAIALVRAGTQQKLTAHELDYGVFEGGPFWDYGAWLRRHGGYARPAGSVKSQHAGLSRARSGGSSGPVTSFGLFSDADLAGMDVRPAFLTTTRLAPDRTASVYVSAFRTPDRSTHEATTACQPSTYPTD